MKTPSEVSAQSMAIFRITIAIILLFEGFRLLKFSEFYFITPEYLFKWHFFQWIPEASALTYMLLSYSLIFFAAMLFIGLFFRVFTILSFIVYAYFFLLEPSYFTNSIYLLLLLLFLLCFTNFDNYLSINQLIKKGSIFYDSKIPKWQINVFIVQFFLVFFYSGLAKIDVDWISAQTMLSIIKNFELTFFKNLIGEQLLAIIITYFLLLYGLSIGFLLWIKKTRIYGIALLLLVQLLSIIFLNTGMSPYLFLTAILLYINPDVVNKIGAHLKSRRKLYELIYLKHIVSEEAILMTQNNKESIQKPFKWFLLLFFSIQVCLPLQHYFIKGNANYTGEGLPFSWRMNSCYKTIVMFKILVKNKNTGESYACKIKNNKQQLIHILYQPTQLKSLAHFIAKNKFKEIPSTDLFVSFLIGGSLNGHPADLLIDYEKNLLEEKRTLLKHNSWIKHKIKPIEGGRWKWIKKKSVDL